MKFNSLLGMELKVFYVFEIMIFFFMQTSRNHMYSLKFTSILYASQFYYFVFYLFLNFYSFLERFSFQLWVRCLLKENINMVIMILEINYGDNTVIFWNTYNISKYWGTKIFILE